MAIPMDFSICNLSISLSKNVCNLKDLSEISRGGRGGWKTGEGNSFLSPSKGRVMKKLTGKEGGSQEIKPP